MHHSPELHNAIVIVGAGGHARVVADLAELGGYAIAGFLDDVATERKGTPFCRAAVIGGSEQLSVLADAGVRQAAVAIGDCEIRLAYADRVATAGMDQPVLCHPTAAVARDATLGPGTVVMAGGIVNPAATVGANVIVNTAASVDHDCTIEDGAHLAPGVRLGGRVHIGRGAWIGIGAVVRDGIRIGAGTIVGAGALVLNDLPAGVVAFGVPARVVREVQHAEAAHR